MIFALFSYVVSYISKGVDYSVEYVYSIHTPKNSLLICSNEESPFKRGYFDR